MNRHHLPLVWLQLAGILCLWWPFSQAFFPLIPLFLPLFLVQVYQRWAVPYLYPCSSHYKLHLHTTLDNYLFLWTSFCTVLSFPLQSIDFRCTLRIQIIILGPSTNLKGCRGLFVLSFTPREKQLPYPHSLGQGLVCFNAIRLSPQHNTITSLVLQNILFWPLPIHISPLDMPDHIALDYLTMPQFSVPFYLT